MTYEDDVATLNITETVLTDAADYKVKATNKLGEVTSQGSLTVHSK